MDPIVGRLLTIKEAAAYLGIAERTLANKVQADQVPHTRIAKHVRFTPEHLAEIVAMGERRPVTKRSAHRSNL